MARKSNQKKKGVENLQASNQTKRSSELNEEERDEHRNKAKPKRQPKKETNGTVRPSPVEIGPTECEEDSKTEATRENGSQENGSTRSPHFDRARFRTRTHRQSRGTFSTMMNGFSIQKAFERIELPDNEFTRSLRALTFSVLKASSEWLERQRQGLVFSAIRTKVETISGYVKTKAQRVYPVALKWLMSIASVLFLMSMVWLDCAVRGIDSFLRLGTTSFFSVVWFSLLYVLAMAGVFKCLVIFAIAGLIGAFIGLSLGILILGLSGVVFLWLYGSFWTTALVIFIGGLAYALSHERVALLVTTVYSVYCAWSYVGWLGLVFGFNLAFVSSDILIYFLKNSVNQQKRPEQTPGSQSFNSQTSSEGSPGFSSDRSPGTPSTSGTDTELTSEDEIVRLLNCADHYSALGLARFENVDISLLKREYRKKAMLVHPDKNMGNEKAAEAFKKLQNAYEVLLDSAKQKSYDDELRKDELLNYFRRFQSTSQMSGGGHSFSGADVEDPLGESRRIACKKCNNFHVWVLTRKSKSQARFCQECNEFHPAKDGDGWVEQSSQPFLFGLMQKVDSPSVFVCADSKIYDATEWYICQGMRCPANTHKPSFQVNTSVSSKYNNNNNNNNSSSQGKGTSSGQRGAQQMPPNGEEEMSEEEFFEWLQSAVQAGVFENLKREDPKTPPSNNNKRKKKGKKPW